MEPFVHRRSAKQGGFEILRSLFLNPIRPFSQERAVNHVRWPRSLRITRGTDRNYSVHIFAGHYSKMMAMQQKLSGFDGFLIYHC